jgi:hypothetical protein
MARQSPARLVLGPAIQALRRFDPAEPERDLTGVEIRLMAHLRALGLAERRVRWLRCGRDVFREADAAPPEDHADPAWLSRMRALERGQPWAGGLAHPTIPDRASPSSVPARALRHDIWLEVERASGEAVGGRYVRRLHHRGEWNRLRLYRGAFLRRAAEMAEAADVIFRVSALAMAGHTELILRAARAWAPLAHAYCDGLWAFWVTPAAVFAAPRPQVRFAPPGPVDLDAPLVHADGGPAVWWPGTGEQQYYFYGTRVSKQLIEAIALLAAEPPVRDRAMARRRDRIERTGLDSYLWECGARMVHEDDTGRLWRITLDSPSSWWSRAWSRPGSVVVVEVRDATPGPDGRRARHLLRVPPAMHTAREAVAWTFGMTPSIYRPAKQA